MPRYKVLLFVDCYSQTIEAEVEAASSDLAKEAAKAKHAKDIEEAVRLTVEQVGYEVDCDRRANSDLANSDPRGGACAGGRVHVYVRAGPVLGTVLGTLYRLFVSGRVFLLTFSWGVGKLASLWLRSS